jgi:uncharacterized protein (DUF305 family)
MKNMTNARLMLALAVLSLMSAVVHASGIGSGFASEMNSAMARMMDAMQIRTTGDVDRDFAAMMIPHHQGAIDMAVAEIRYGTNPQLKRIAQEIIVDQQQEIAAMKVAIGDPLPPSSPAPTQPSSREPQKER